MCLIGLEQLFRYWGVTHLLDVCSAIQSAKTLESTHELEVS